MLNCIIINSTVGVFSAQGDPTSSFFGITGVDPLHFFVIIKLGQLGWMQYLAFLGLSPVSKVLIFSLNTEMIEQMTEL